MRDQRYQTWQGQDNLFAATIPIILLVGVNNSLAATILLFVVGGFWLKHRDERYSDWVKLQIERQRNYSDHEDTALSARMIADHLGLNFNEERADINISNATIMPSLTEAQQIQPSWDDLEIKKLEIKMKLDRLKNLRT